MRFIYHPVRRCSCFSKIQIGFTFLVPAHLGSPGKRAVKRVCVCVCVRACVRACVCACVDDADARQKIWPRASKRLYFLHA